MPAATVWMLRASLFWFLFSVTSGSLMLLEKSMIVHGGWMSLYPFHIEAAMVGWMVQFVVAVAYWMFPRHLTGRPRGHPIFGWLLTVLLNGSVVVAMAALWYTGLAMPARALFAGSAVLFLWMIWKRVASYR